MATIQTILKRRMETMSEKGGNRVVHSSRARLAHLENVLQELTRCEEHKRKQKIESATISTQHKLLTDQLLQTQEALAAAQARKAQLCEEIGILKQTKEHQGKQLDQYKLDLQSACESKAQMVKKVEELEKSMGTIKQQYIRSLASRIKTSALVLQQLNVKNGTPFSNQVAETCTEWEQDKPTKRKRVSEIDETSHVAEGDDKSKQTVKSAENSFGSTESRPSESVAEDVPVATRMPNNDAAISDDRELIPHAKHDALNSEQDCEDGIMNEKKWQAQFNTVKSEYSVLHEKYNALLREHDTILVEKATAVKELSACKANIAQLTQQLETSRSKQPESTTQACVSSEKDKEAQEKRIKMLEDNLAQLNGYADQLEIVIARCPSCTVKLQNESTQDSLTNRGE